MPLALAVAVVIGGTGPAGGSGLAGGDVAHLYNASLLSS